MTAIQWPNKTKAGMSEQTNVSMKSLCSWACSSMALCTKWEKLPEVNLEASHLEHAQPNFKIN